MHGYHHTPVGELAAELSAGLLRLRKGYLDHAEELIRIIDPAQEYPYEFVVFRLTGYRGRRDKVIESLPGGTLRADLLRLMIKVSESFPLNVSECEQAVLDLPATARRFNVSTKTVQRWRMELLPARRMVFGDGKIRLGFLNSTLTWFEDLRRQSLERSARFHQLTVAERADIIRRAARMAKWAQCSLAEVCRRIAERTGRAVETIRYTIRQHDVAHPGQAVFPHLLAGVKEDDREVIYRCFLHGVSVPTLAAKYGRSRGSIYRIINEMRARMLLRRPIGYIYNPQFELPNADETILEPPTNTNLTVKSENGIACDFANGDVAPDAPDAPKKPRVSTNIPDDLPPYLRDLYDVSLLTPQQERELFRRYNYLKYKADQLRKQINLNRVRTVLLRHIEALLIQANGVKNEITRANLRLVVSIAKKHLGGPQELFELVSDGNISLMKAVEKFDFSRGFRFSTYGSWAIMRNYARTIPMERFQLDRYEATQDEVLDVEAGLAKFDPNAVNLPELRESIDAVLAQLSPRERTILIDHYGLDKDGSAMTLDQLGKNLGISKERVRQIEAEALRKLRTILHPQKSELMR